MCHYGWTFCNFVFGWLGAQDSTQRPRYVWKVLFGFSMDYDIDFRGIYTRPCLFGRRVLIDVFHLPACVFDTPDGLLGSL